jgi:hypothetical protein
MACHDMECMPSCVDWSDRFSETVSEDSWDRRRGIGRGHVIQERKERQLALLEERGLDAGDEEGDLGFAGPAPSITPPVRTVVFPPS